MGLRAGAIGGCGGCAGTFESIATSTAQFIDLARRLVLAGGNLLDGLAQRRKAQCYLLSLSRVVDANADRDQVTSEQNSPFRLPFWRAFRLPVCCQEALKIFEGGMFV